MSYGLEFSKEKIDLCRREGKLLSMDLEFINRCNLKCTYCYNSFGSQKNTEGGVLSLNEIYSIIDQANDMGVEIINLIGGGEPLLYPELFDIIKKIQSHQIRCCVVTNGTLITPDIAKKFYQMDVDLVVKLDSLDELTHDKITGVPGTFKKAKKALDDLMSAGYGSGKGPVLATHTIICNLNYDQIPEIYLWTRNRNLSPYIESATLQGNAKSNNISVPSDKIHSLFKKLLDIDQKQFGKSWEITPHLAGLNCQRLFYNVYITYLGEVQPCAGITLSGGNIREISLREVISTDLFKKTRNIDKLLPKKCKDCEHSSYCYGCRGNTFQQTGDIAGLDPDCWNCNN